MTDMTCQQLALEEMRSPLARLLHRAAKWQEQRHTRRMLRVSYAEVPEDLRWDVGLDGGAPLQRAPQSGRSFVHDNSGERVGNGYFW